MIFFYLLFIIIFVIGIRFVKDNKEYLNKDMTTVINGMFVITIFFSHFMTYINSTNIYDNYLVTVLRFIGQLMVTSFLFYSGYGIYESIKNKSGYMKSFFRKRFVPTFVNFALAVILFLIVDFILGNYYTIDKILLSFIGYESIGNSNWYMLAIFVIYVFVMLCFNTKIKCSNVYRIIFLSVLVIIYVYVISNLKDSYYADTVLCFPLGMWYSYFKEKIDHLLVKKYYLCLIVSIILFVSIHFLKRYYNNVYTYNLYAVCFIVFIILLTRKIKIKSSIISFFGVHTFWIYILQRIPMMILQNKLNNYVYIVSCFILTIALSWIMKKYTDKIWHKKN